MAVIQQLWDRAEPSGFIDVIGPSNPLPNTPTQAVLLHYGLGDAQVTWLGAMLLQGVPRLSCMSPMCIALR